MDRRTKREKEGGREDIRNNFQEFLNIFRKIFEIFWGKCVGIFEKILKIIGRMF